MEYLFKSKCKHLGKHCGRVSRMVFAEEGLQGEVGYVRLMIKYILG